MAIKVHDSPNFFLHKFDFWAATSLALIATYLSELMLRGQLSIFYSLAAVALLSALKGADIGRKALAFTVVGLILLRFLPPASWRPYDARYFERLILYVITGLGTIAIGDLLHRAWKHLEKVNDELKRERESREVFVAQLCHDLRTPLSIAKGNADFLILHEKEAPLETTYRMHRVTENLNRMDHMLQSLLEASRIHLGEKPPLSISKFEITAVVKSSVKDLENTYHANLRVEAHEEITGQWCRAGVTRIIENLVLNAIKYGEPKKPIQVSTERSKDGHELFIRVHNFGNPITKDIQIFKPFTRGEKSGDNRGWGLGLTVVKGLAEAHGGRITYASSLEKGTVFTVSLPINSHPDSIETR